MKRFHMVFLFLALTGMGLFAQENKSIDGIWFGTLKVESMGTSQELRLAITVSGSTTGELKAVLTSIDQGRAEVPMDEASLDGDKLTVSHAAAGIVISGTIDPEKASWETDFTQGPVAAPIIFKKVEKIPE